MTCMFCGSRASQKCLVCEGYFCEGCSEFHVKIFKDSKRLARMEKLEDKVALSSVQQEGKD
jgi:hypothetical protein